MFLWLTNNVKFVESAGRSALQLPVSRCSCVMQINFTVFLSLELLKLYLDTGLGVIKKLKYEGAKPLKILKTINRILNSILNFTGSQCKSTNKGVMWQYLLSLHINLAHMFCTRCSLLSWYSSRPYKRLLEKFFTGRLCPEVQPIIL